MASRHRRASLSEVVITFLGLLLAFGPVACGDDSNPPPAVTVFRFSMANDTTHQQDFFAWTSDSGLISKIRAELMKPESERSLFPSGRLLRGDGGHNAPWHWHLDPDNWDMVEVSVEVCDGNPSDVEADLDYWVDTVKAFCPWTARVQSEAGD